ncbi:MAG: hypothetical protein PHQ32_05545 [Firmicutes bacterium]|nr:hypothetical protein [Bacillota bacterium]
MRKNNILVLLLFAISMFFVVGCDDNKDGGEDSHYKPSEYKHNVAISDANRAVADIEREIISFGAETSVDILINTYNDGIKELNAQIVKLNETKAQLKEDSDLTSSELQSWESNYKDTITGVKNSIKEIERKKAKIYE